MLQNLEIYIGNYLSNKSSTLFDQYLYLFHPNICIVIFIAHSHSTRFVLALITWHSLQHTFSGIVKRVCQISARVCEFHLTLVALPFLWEYVHTGKDTSIVVAYNTNLNTHLLSSFLSPFSPLNYIVHARGIYVVHTPQTRKSCKKTTKNPNLILNTEPLFLFSCATL